MFTSDTQNRYWAEETQIERSNPTEDAHSITARHSDQHKNPLSSDCRGLMKHLTWVIVKSGTHNWASCSKIAKRDGWHDGDDADVSKACSAFIFRVKRWALQQHRWDKLKFRSKRGFLILWVTVTVGPNKTHDREREREKDRVTR